MPAVFNVALISFTCAIICSLRIRFSA